MSARRILVTFLTIFVWINRLPAPIVEEEKPAPAPTAERSEAPKRKHSARSTTTSEQSSSRSETKTIPARAPAAQGPARFAGTWSGKVNQGLLGHVASSVTVTADATSVVLSHNLGGNTRPATISGNLLTWKSGVAGEVTWTLKPNSDGHTAQVTMKGMVLNDTVTFERGK